MSYISDYRIKPEDVGDILLKVQEDLRHLKDQIVNQRDSRADLTEIQEAIEKTEIGVRHKTEQVLTIINNRVQTLPTLDHVSKDVLPENAINLRTLAESSWIARRNPVANATTDEALSDRVKAEMTQKAMLNPYNSQNRQVLNDSYGVQLPLITDRKGTKPLGQKPVLGSTVEPLAVLPAANRKDPQLAPPAITENDAKHGILSLLERGLIPPGAELTLDPSPVRHKLISLHDPGSKKLAKTMADSGYNLSAIQFDTNAKDDMSSMPMHSVTDGGTRKSDPSTALADRPLRKNKSIHIPRTATVPQKTVQLQLQPVPPPTTPALVNGKQLEFKFPIQNGRTRENSADFLAFRQHYCLSWGPIVSVISKLESLLKNYAIPVAFINGSRLADLSLEYELEREPSTAELLNTLINKDDVQQMMKKPGQRFKGPDGRVKAVTLIQASWRCHKCRKVYTEYRRRKYAAGVIALTWIMNVKMATMKKQLVVTRKRQLKFFHDKSKELAGSWTRIKNSRRVIIHVPSLGYSQKIRDSMGDIMSAQNAQMGRLCDIRDPNVDVIYVSPLVINEEGLQYYTKLLGLKPAIDSGNVDDQTELTDRYKIIVPEAIKSFPTHRMCLSSHLKYSPKALKRIRSLIKGRDAYIIPGMPHLDDLSVAEFLGVPVLCSDPDVAHIYSTKSGSKRIFQAAGVSIPPGELDVYTLPQLHDSLSQLITDHLDVSVWLFKIDGEFNARGTAVINIAEHMKCYAWARKESDRYGDKWSKKWAQEPAFLKIHSEILEVLEKYALPVDNSMYSSWREFSVAFLAKGGVIEATPPSDSVTSLTVDMFIEPDGTITMVSCGDQIHADTPYRKWGLSTPQASVEPAVLNKECVKIAEACKSRGIVGYFSIDFITYIDSKSEDQVIWATDLDLHYTDSMAMANLAHFMSNGTFNSETHMYDVPPQKMEKKRRRLRTQVDDSAEPPPTTNRYVIHSTKLHHSNLSVVHYSVFFQMCRAHGIGYDVKEKQGTVFTLIDSFNRENLGMLTIGDNLQAAFATFARNLSCIHQEISAPNMQGETNFKYAVEDIEAILGMTILNAEEERSQTSAE